MKIYTEQEINYAYIAGFFDGEGSPVMTYTFYPDRVGSNRKSRRIACRISIPNRDLETLRWMQGIMGGMGKIWTRPKPKDKPEWNQVYDWGIKKFADMLRFSELVSPFIHNDLKKEKFRLLMVYCKLRLAKKEKGYLPKQRLGEEEFGLLDQFMSVGCNH